MPAGTCSLDSDTLALISSITRCDRLPNTTTTADIVSSGFMMALVANCRNTPRSCRSWPSRCCRISRRNSKSSSEPLRFPSCSTTNAVSSELATRCPRPASRPPSSAVSMVPLWSVSYLLNASSNSMSSALEKPSRSQKISMKLKNSNWSSTSSPSTYRADDSSMMSAMGFARGSKPMLANMVPNSSTEMMPSPFLSHFLNSEASVTCSSSRTRRAKTRKSGNSSTSCWVYSVPARCC
mmetsp:Transcript_14199/g.37512  ORF Transcript_14199/g.37512 Transcript_14199/m.37512 type:complete len:238 (-) Transcript_14199:818-1531(-)